MEEENHRVPSSTEIKELWLPDQLEDAWNCALNGHSPHLPEHSLEENATNEQTIATTKQIQKKHFGFLFPLFFLSFFLFFLSLSTGFVGSVFPHFTDEEIETQRYWVTCDLRARGPSSAPLFFEVWSWDQRLQHQLPRNWWEMQILSSTPGPLNQKLWCWGPAFQILTSPLGVSDAAKD